MRVDFDTVLLKIKTAIMLFTTMDNGETKHGAGG